MGAWGGRCTQDLDEVELAAMAAIGSIARFLEIPPREAGCKSMSFKDALARVADYSRLVG